jgi:hypothetical protein
MISAMSGNHLGNDYLWSLEASAAEQEIGLHSQDSLQVRRIAENSV